MKKILITGILISAFFSINCSSGYWKARAKRTSCNSAAKVAGKQAVNTCLEKINEGKEDKDKVKSDASCNTAGSAARSASYTACYH